MDTVGPSRARGVPPPIGGKQLFETSYQVSEAACDWGFDDAGAAFISLEDQAFSQHERRRVGTDVASNVISYGITSAETCAAAIADQFSIPHIQLIDLQAIAEVCRPSDIPQMVRQGAVPVSWTLGHTSHAAILPASRRQNIPGAYGPNLDITALTTRQEFGDAFRGAFGHKLTDDAANRLSREAPEFSASSRLSAGQKVVMSVLALGLGLCALLDPGVIWPFVLGIASVYFLAVVVLRAFALSPPITSADPPSLADHELPFYSVLVPLYKEAHMIPQLLDGLCALDYPHYVGTAPSTL